jgi:hypothetical protein
MADVCPGCGIGLPEFPYWGEGSDRVEGSARAVIADDLAATRERFIEPEPIEVEDPPPDLDRLDRMLAILERVDRLITRFESTAWGRGLLREPKSRRT